jgi:signal transduction histidine kinase
MTAPITIPATEKVLLVDDDQNLLDGCARHLRKRFDLHTSAEPRRGLELLDRAGPFAVVVSDMRMPGMDGVQFLAAVKAHSPESIRMMLTGHPDLQTAMDAVNQGNIFRFLTKPCAPENLAAALDAGLEQFRLVRTRQELMEMKLRHAQKLELVGQCAAGAAHDLRNILAVIQLSADIALELERDGARLDEHLRQISDAAANAANLTQQLVAFSRRQEHVKFDAVDVCRQLTDLSQLLRHILPKRIAIRCDCPPDLPPARADVGMLNQVLMNLALNARDAMPGPGTLKLHADAAELAPGALPRHPDARAGRFVTVSVADTGCGMDATVRQRIFEPFFTTKPEGQGTGLGLAVVAEIVRQHRGWIEVTSQVGQGSTFKVVLPVWPADAAGTKTGGGT